MEPGYYEGRGKWQLHGDWDLSAITRFFFYSEVLFYIFNQYWGEDYRSLKYRGLRYTEVRYFVVSLYIVESSQKRKNVFRESCFHR